MLAHIKGEINVGRLLTKEQILKTLECYEHLPDAENIEMTILKGHLLAEIKMKEYIEKFMPNPTGFMSSKRWTFAELVYISKALCKSKNIIWVSLKNLNLLRNKLAHDLDDKIFKKAIESFLMNEPKKFYKNESNNEPDIHKHMVYIFSSLVSLINNQSTDNKK